VVSRENRTLYEEIQAAYGRHRLTGKPPKKYEEVAQTIARYGFRDVQTKLFHSSRTFSAEDYIRLLNTYSDHQTMEPNAKAALEQDIRQAILAAGGMVQLTDTMDLYLAKK
jgi:predicted component of type VI protein secretion system